MVPATSNRSTQERLNVSKFKFPKELLVIEVPDADGSFAGITDLGSLDDGDVVAVYDLREVKTAIVERTLAPGVKARKK